MKLVKAIKLHRKLRIDQEFYCDKCCKWTQDISGNRNPVCPDLKNLSIHNRAVKRVEKKLPSLYFLLSDLFGGCSSIRRLSLEKIEGK